MAFRDDRDALRARIASLQDELRDADAANDRLRRERDEALRELARLEAEAETGPEAEPEPPIELPEAPEVPEELEPARPGTRPHEDAEGSSLDEVLSRKEPRRGLGLGPGCGLVLLAALAALGLFGWKLYRDLELDRAATARWRGEVTAAEGAGAPAVGASCEAQAWMRGDGEARFRVDGLQIRCGGRLIYSWQEPVEELSGEDAPGPVQRCSRLIQHEVDPSSRRYVLACRDIGGRAGGRPELGLDTDAEQLRVWRDVPPIFRVEVRLDRESELTRAPPLLAQGGEGHW